MKGFKIAKRITDRSSNSFKLYLNEVNNIDVFCDNEEKVCADLAYNGDAKAREDLIKKNLRFVVSVAKSYVTSDVFLEDLVNEGNEGLIIAANRFDPNKGYKFISYAVWWIRRHILYYISSNSKTIRIPTNKVDELLKLKKELAEKSQVLGRDATINDLINDAVSDKDIQVLENLCSISNMNVVSIESPVNDYDDINFGDVIADDSFGNTDDELMSSDLKKTINKVLTKLNERERIILTSLFGLNGSKQLTLEECAQLDGVNVSREMVRQIKSKALRKVKINLRNVDLN